MGSEIGISTRFLVVENQVRDARLYRDRAATDPIPLTTPAATANPLLAMQLPTPVKAFPVGGLARHEEYYLVGTDADTNPTPPPKKYGQN